jgi:DNA-binding PadR family transcriptional regulator
MKSNSAPPLTEPTLFILLSLAPEPRHGYAIMKDVERLSEGRVAFSTGTLYGALKRLLDQGWIRRVSDPNENDTARERKAYALTDRGRRVLRAEVARLQKLVSAAQLRGAVEQA